MSAHTPGPWHRNIKPATKYPTIFAGRNTHVAHVATGGLPPEEVEANLRLIQAAPELRAALAAIVEEAEAACERYSGSDMNLRTARALLAKVPA